MAEHRSPASYPANGCLAEPAVLGAFLVLGLAAAGCDENGHDPIVVGGGGGGAAGAAGAAAYVIEDAALLASTINESSGTAEGRTYL